FNNGLDDKLFQSKMVRVEPAVIGLKCRVFYKSVELSGAFEPRGQYRIHVEGLTDTLGQQLEKPIDLSLQVPPRRPYLHAASGNRMVVLPSGQAPVAEFRSLNHAHLRVRRYRVTPQEWPAYLKDSIPLGEPAAESEFTLQPDRVETISIPLPEQPGQWLVEVSDGTARARTWAQVTGIGLDAFSDPTRLRVFTTELRSGKPQPARLQLGGAGADSGGDGWAQLPLGSSEDVLVATRGDDLAFLPGPWKSQLGPEEMAWYMTDARRIYRPGDTVHFKGWLRRLPFGKALERLPTGQEVHYVCKDPRDQVIREGTAVLTPQGGFDSRFALPASVPLGICTLRVEPTAVSPDAIDRTGELTFEVAEYRRPEFEVSAVARDAFAVLGESSQVEVTARYFSGGPLPRAGVTWSVRPQQAFYRPPGWTDYTFGDWEYGELPTQTRASHCDDQGTDRLRIEHLKMRPGSAVKLEIQALVQDANHQTWTAQTGFLLHPARLYVGLKRLRNSVTTIVTDINGRSVQAPVTVTLNDRHGRKLQEISGIQPDLSIDTPGDYKVTALVRDEQGRLARSQLSLYDWPSKSFLRRRPSRRPKRLVSLTLDRELYEPGQTAQLRVSSPVPQARGILTLRRQGVVYQQDFELKEGAARLHFPLSGEWMPNVKVQVDLLAPGLSGGHAVAQQELAISPASQRLRVTLSNPPKKKPGENAQVKVRVVDSQQRPVSNAEVMLSVVDEALLALVKDADLPDPIDIFYGRREAGADLSQHLHWRSKTIGEAQGPSAQGGSITLDLDYADLVYAIKEIGRQMGRNVYIGPGVEGVVSAHFQNLPGTAALELLLAQADEEIAFKLIGYNTLVVAAPEKVNQIEADILGKQFAPRPSGGPRADFSPLAAFLPALRTDARGWALGKFRLPDSLTRYRILAIAAHDLRFGRGQGTLQTSLPLMVRPSLPRFLVSGDRCQPTVLVQNLSSRAITVSLVGRASNATLTGGGRLSLPPHGRREVLFDLMTQQPGTVRCQFLTQGEGHTDAAEVSLPVWTPASRETYATYGVVDSPSASLEQPLSIPSGEGRLEVSTSSTAASQLQDASVYLNDYPYQCSEQLASRILACHALNMDKQTDADVEELEKRLQPDGGFAFWPGLPSHPFVSLHAIHALIRTGHVKAESLDYLEQYADHLQEVTPGVTHSLRAYAVYLRRLAGHPDPQQAVELVRERGAEGMGHDAMGWLLPSLPVGSPERLAVRTALADSLSETTSGVQLLQQSSFWTLGSERRSEAILLEALVGEDAHDELLPKLVRSLLAGRRQGRWNNTQENCFALLALKAYFDAAESVEPDFQADFWTGQEWLGRHAFHGRATPEQNLQVPLNQVRDSVSLVKSGPGRLYYRLGLTYTPEQHELKALQAGFTVTRRYQAVDQPGDVTVDKDGICHIRVGSLVRVVVKLQSPGRREHVALVDPMPAGLEAVPNQRPGGWLHTNLRDDRVEAFTDVCEGGELSYLARATTRGHFTAPPARAEEMYSPETFGRCATQKVVVE
ncbi:hypothetical protein IV102_35845, partial [bacterium]|nr:hypothetical protein [bacterium]